MDELIIATWIHVYTEDYEIPRAIYVTGKGISIDAARQHALRLVDIMGYDSSIPGDERQALKDHVTIGKPNLCFGHGFFAMWGAIH